MSQKEEDVEEETPPYRIKLLRCRRTDQWIAPSEHEECRFCFGTETEVERGRYTMFCDFRPGVDAVGAELPIHPGRYTSG